MQRFWSLSPPDSMRIFFLREGRVKSLRQPQETHKEYKRPLQGGPCGKEQSSNQAPSSGRRISSKERGRGCPPLLNFQSRASSLDGVPPGQEEVGPPDPKRTQVALDSAATASSSSFMDDSLSRRYQPQIGSRGDKLPVIPGQLAGDCPVLDGDNPQSGT
ncbi:hypothetical protein E2C01_007623 [Portunus trituberculatus]|uniref:Uncharacterized protein n=1 Tax=Portunus trituberculatus TaxID=210409 RepID=A0A5B7CYL5_PORTR|nr:hypothetical protein [Portunus trituberculatus]